MIRNILSDAISNVVSNIMRGVDGLPVGDLPPISVLNYREPLGGATVLKRYQANLDGLSSFWKRGVNYVTAVNGVVAIVFSVKDFAAEYFLIHGSAGTPFPVFLNVTTGFISFPAGATAELNGTAIADNTVAPVLGDINLLVFVDTVGGRTVDRFGATAIVTSALLGAVTAALLLDPGSSANTFLTKFSDNSPYENSIGTELGVELRAEGDLIGLNIPTHDINFGTFDISPDASFSRYVIAGNNKTNNECFFWVGVDTGPFVVIPVGEFKIIIAEGIASPIEASFRSSFGDTPVIGDIVNISLRGLSDTASTLENGEPDGSDREPITRKSDNSGFIGTSVDYDYAPGANP